MWLPEDITFDLKFNHSEGRIWLVTIQVPGAVIELMGEVLELGPGLTATGVHVQVKGTGDRLTRSKMRVIAQRIMEEMGYDQIIIVGAVRTSGARPGNRPRILRFP